MKHSNRTYALGGEIEINRLGYGAMRLTGQPGNYGPYEDWDGGVALLRRAADLGVDFFDSAWAYGPETADRIVGEALFDRPVVLATKGGVDKPAPGRIIVDGSRDTLHRQIDGALKNLKRDQIDLFQLHRVDPATP
ncbi:MAG: aldo/keto reductase, partial [Woeseiaceae bacterium]|nr:aldo/keto reductase [Woeseiaceae bacterium]